MCFDCSDHGLLDMRDFRFSLLCYFCIKGSGLLFQSFVFPSFSPVVSGAQRASVGVAQGLSLLTLLCSPHLVFCVTHSPCSASTIGYVVEHGGFVPVPPPYSPSHR